MRACMGPLVLPEAYLPDPSTRAIHNAGYFDPHLKIFRLELIWWAG